MNYAELARITGQAQESNGPMLPRLVINHVHETDEGKPIPAGTYAVSSLDKPTVYAKTADFRPYINGYQYQVYDSELKKYTNKTVIFKNFNEEQLDELGGTACGKVTGKAKNNLTEAQVTLQKKIKCYRFLYGTVSMTGVDVDGNECTLTDEPCLWRSTGSVFMPVGEVLQVMTKAQRLSFQATIKLDKTIRDKNGNTVYYKPVLVADMKTVKQIDNKDFELLTQFQDIIDGENSKVIDKHMAAKRHSLDQAEIDGIQDEIIDAGFLVLDDLNDDISNVGS